MTATVTELPIAKRRAKPVSDKPATAAALRSPRAASQSSPSAKRATRAPTSPATLRSQRNQRVMGYAFGGLAVSLTALSLSHLAEGVAAICHRSTWEAWSVAVAIDVGFIATELAPFAIPAQAATDTRRSRLAFSVCVLCASAAFNAVAFAADAAGPSRYAAMVIGVAVPAAIAYFATQAGRLLVGRSH